MEACAIKQIMPKLIETGKIRSIVKDRDTYFEYLIKDSHLNEGVIMKLVMLYKILILHFIYQV